MSGSTSTSWPIPTPDVIAARAAGVLEAEFAAVYAARNPGAPPAIVDARGPNSLLAIYARTNGLSLFGTYLYMARLAAELMPDTATVWLSRHGNIWGVPQDQASVSVGNSLAVSAVTTTLVPSGTELSAAGGVIVVTTAPVTIDGGTSAVLPLATVAAGAASAVAAGTVLQIVSPIAGLAAQTVTVDANGLTGGLDLESTASWRSRILQRIQQRGGGGNARDYAQWVREIIPGALVLASSPQLGEVTVAVALPGVGSTSPATVPDSAVIATIQAYVSDPTQRKPLGMTATVIAATLVPVPVSVHLNPSTAAVQAAASAALQLYFNSDLTIGGTLYVSRLDGALSVGSGEYDHDRALPAADVTATVGELLVLGAVTYT